jgi:ubiquinone/menaquinone biosynthesis C-methylase UbiE
MRDEQHRMAEGASIYHQNAAVYDLFAQAEDAPGYVALFLKQRLANRDVLDVGCGTGKYLSFLAPVAKSYIGLDVSADQLNIAHSRARNHKNASLRCIDALRIDLASQSVDAIIATWVLESIREPGKKQVVLEGMKRLLKPGGTIYLVENSGESEFETIIRRNPDISTTIQNRDWLLSQGFQQIKSWESYFEFNSKEEAHSVFQTIWGSQIASRITNRRINHGIKIYALTKETEPPHDSVNKMDVKQ